MAKQEDVEILPKENEITLTDLIGVAGPLLKQWTDSENEIRRMELEFDYKIQQMFAKQNSIMTVGLITLLSFVLILTGVLLYFGKDSSALDLIKLIAGLGGAAFGGYGWASRRHRANEEDI